jgi:hypothetical protein
MDGNANDLIFRKFSLVVAYRRWNPGIVRESLTGIS